MSEIHLKQADYHFSPQAGSVIASTYRTVCKKQDGTVFGAIKILGGNDNARVQLQGILFQALETICEYIKKGQHQFHAFESVVQTVNQELGQFSQANPQVPITDLHAILGITFDNQVYLTGTGNLEALFMHKRGVNRYALYPLHEQFHAGTNTNWNAPFIDILDGNLVEDDILYIGSSIPTQELTQEDFQTILITLPPQGALERLAQFSGPHDAYTGLVFAMKRHTVQKRPKKVNPLTSLNQLSETKASTASLLGTESVAAASGEFFSKLTKPLVQRLSAPGHADWKSYIKKCVRLFLKLLAFLGDTLIKAMRFIIKQLKRHSQTEQDQHVSFVERIQSIKSRIPHSVIIVGIVVIFAIITLVIAISISSGRQAKKAALEAFSETATRIEEKIDSAEASLIYNNNDQAKQLLTEATALLATLDIQTNSQETTQETLQDAINTLFYQLRGVERIEPNMLAQAPGQVTQFGEINNSLFALQQDNTLLRFDELDLTFTAVDMNTASIGQISFMTGEGDAILAVDENNQLIRLSPSINTINAVVSGTNAQGDVTSMAVYNDKLYSFSAANESIIRMQPQGNGYDAGTAWISSSLSSLSDGKDLAIDGDIYILQSSNITRFNAGKELTYSLETVEPPLQAATKLWTSVDTAYLYVLEPNESRILVFTKDGDLVTQYTHESIASAVDMVVREDENTMILLTDTELFSFTLSHLLK